MSDLVKIATTDDLSPGQMMAVEVEGVPVLLANVDGSYHAVSDVCTHAEASLSEGDLEEDEVTCPWHASVFRLGTGEVLSPPAEEPLDVYEVRVEGKDILVRVE